MFANGIRKMIDRKKLFKYVFSFKDKLDSTDERKMRYFFLNYETFMKISTNYAVDCSCNYCWCLVLSGLTQVSSSDFCVIDYMNSRDK